MANPQFSDGEDVLVWRPNSGEWVRGVVHGSAERDGAWKHFVQLSGYAAASADNPRNWFLEGELRNAG